MAGLMASVGALLLSVALLLTGNGLQGTLLPVRASLEDFSTFDIGILGSAYYTGFVLGCILGPRMVGRVGHIRAFTALAAIASTVALAHALIVEPGVWWPLRAITGYCFAGLYVVIESWLNARSTNKTRGTILSIYTMINLTVMTLGQLMIMLYDPAAFPLFALASILVSVAAVPVALTNAKAPPPPTVTLLRPRRLLSISPVGFVGCFMVGMANGPFWTLGPLFASGSGLDIAGIALFMSITVIAGAIGQYPLGFLSDRIDRRRVIFGACIGGCLAGVALATLNAFWANGLLPLAFFFGLFALPMYALCVAHANDFISPDEFVEASGGLLLANGAGSVVGPLLASAAMAQFGVAGLFAFTAVVHLVMALFTLYRMGKRSPVAPAERDNFVAAVETASPTVLPLDPRGEALEDTPPPEEVVEAEVVEEENGPEAIPPDEAADGEPPKPA